MVVPNPKRAAAKAQATVSGIRERALLFMRQIIVPLLRSTFQGREDGSRVQAIFEGDDLSPCRGGEGFGGGAKRLGGGDEDAVTPLCGLPQELDPLHQVPLGPE